jgi:hypothetical protein
LARCCRSCRAPGLGLDLAGLCGRLVMGERWHSPGKQASRNHNPRKLLTDAQPGANLLVRRAWSVERGGQ